jgi:hypothetical protein
VLVDADDRAFLLGLPTLAAANDFLLTHGDAKLTRALSTADERQGFRHAYAALAEAGARLWFFGHSHHARVWRKRAADAPAERLEADVLTLEPTGTRYLVNVGTTGRRLAGRGPASFTLYDSERGRLERVLL